MINIEVFSNKTVTIEGHDYIIETQDDMIKLVKAILDRAYYSGEKLCLIKADIEGSIVYFTEIERY